MTADSPRPQPTLDRQFFLSLPSTADRSSTSSVKMPGMAAGPSFGGAAVASGGTSSANASSRASPAVGVGGALSTMSGKAAKKTQVNSNGYHPHAAHTPLSAMKSASLDLSTVERRDGANKGKSPPPKKSRPHGLEDAPTYHPTEEEWKDPMEFMRKIAPEAREYGICKIVPPESWNPDFAIDTEVGRGPHPDGAWERRANLMAEISLPDTKARIELG